MKKKSASAQNQAPEMPETLAPETAEAAPAEAAAEEELVAREIETLRDQLLRLRADFENYRKRTERDRQALAARAAEQLLKALLPVSDHFELGLKAARDHGVNPSVLSGFELVYEQLQNVMRQAGLEPIEAVGRPFDPLCHEAVGQVEKADLPPDTVIEEVRRGYKLGDHVLRPAQVIVNRHEPLPAAESQPSA